MHLTGNIFCDGFNTLISVFTIPAFFSLIMVAFLWALCVFVFVGDYDEEARARAKALILWSSIMCILMTIIWALFAWLFGSAFFAHICSFTGI